MKKRGIQLWVHILCCIIFLSLPFFFSPDGPNDPVAFFRNSNSHRELTRYALLIGFFYFNFYFLIPRLYFRKQYGVYALIIAVCFLITMLLPGLLFTNAPSLRSLPPMPAGGFPSPPPGMPGPPGKFLPPGNSLFHNFRQHIFLFLAAFFFSLLLRIRERLRRAEKQKLQAELAYLRAQINPHFLFNTLNGIYSLAISKSDETAPAIVKLSEMMRYVLYEAGNHYVSLEKELTYLDDFVELQALRFGKQVPVVFTVSGSPAGLSIAPLILITFVENAFKYGVNAEEEMRIEIMVEIKNDVLHLRVYNKKVKVQASAQSGLGIENARNRLELMYPQAYQLAIEETPRDFTVLLTLKLK